MNDKIDWKRKLTSRKLWMAIIGFVTGLIIFLGGSQETATQVAALILQAASILAYIIGEGLSDTAPVDNSTNVTIEPFPEEGLEQVDDDEEVEVG